ncbi:hypothetical protein AVEN_43692-1 [Araneus ventricosus]|uniref:Uncharacterized protein n=1 Tax=Araneus ventricosus TaxID=182803 RepID=A0A4Y2TSG6_ARAVE|nr:hypothetical protein AVEN_43692-1 [Araneus ventricosus]
MRYKVRTVTVPRGSKRQISVSISKTVQDTREKVELNNAKNTRICDRDFRDLAVRTSDNRRKDNLLNNKRRPHGEVVRAGYFCIIKPGKYLVETFEHKIIGYGGCVEWLPRSPDLTHTIALSM